MHAREHGAVPAAPCAQCRRPPHWRPPSPPPAAAASLVGPAPPRSCPPPPAPANTMDRWIAVCFAGGEPVRLWRQSVHTGHLGANSQQKNATTSTQVLSLCGTRPDSNDRGDSSLLCSLASHMSYGALLQISVRDVNHQKEPCSTPSARHRHKRCPLLRAGPGMNTAMLDMLLDMCCNYHPIAHVQHRVLPTSEWQRLWVCHPKT